MTLFRFCASGSWSLRDAWGFTLLELEVSERAPDESERSEAYSLCIRANVHR